MSDSPMNDPKWKNKTLEALLFSSLKEQRAKRRWGVFFKLLFFTGFFLLFMILWTSFTELPNNARLKPHIGIIDIRGVIGDEAPASADNIIKGLEEAFEQKNLQALVLRINSPGGSPVQAAQIYKEIRYLRKKNPKIKIYALCGDLCASAAYYIASASEDIYADPSSLVGSIGVVMNGFGFVDTLNKLGIERRLLTSGEHKGFLDPFSQQKPEEKEIAIQMMNDIHEQFIDAVKQGRGQRLKSDTQDLFSGLVWTGKEALNLGLIDGFADIFSLSRDLFKNNNIVDYTVKPGLLEQLSDRVGASFAHKVGTVFGLSSVSSVQA